MQITTHYTRDLRRTIRATVRPRHGSRVLGVVCVLLAVLAYAAGQPAVLVALFAAYSVVMFALGWSRVLLWLALRRNRSAYEVDVDVEVTDRGISTKTATQSTHVTWEMVQRVTDGGDFWVFDINRLQKVVLFKSDLTPDQRAELSAFLASRSGVVTSAGSRRGAGLASRAKLRAAFLLGLLVPPVVVTATGSWRNSSSPCVVLSQMESTEVQITGPKVHGCDTAASKDVSTLTFLGLIATSPNFPLQYGAPAPTGTPFCTVTVQDRTWKFYFTRSPVHPAAASTLCNLLTEEIGHFPPSLGG